MGTFRASAVLTGFALLTLPLMPVQAGLVRFWPAAARRFPNWYHRQVCRLMGVTLVVDGAVSTTHPVLLVTNHTSWLDIPVLSALAPVSFVAKKEVGGWPFVSSLARLQRSVFVDRTRRQDSGEAANEIMNRLIAGDNVVLFAEGTSSAGHTVLPFKSSLFAAVKGTNAPPAGAVVVQTAAVVYTHLHGIPLQRADRPKVGWYGDMEMQRHAWDVLKGGPLTVTIRVSDPVPLSDFADRKALAIRSEREIRRSVVAILRGRPEDKGLAPVEPPQEARRSVSTPQTRSEKWT